VSSLEGKVALVTGAARGQGRAHAVRLAAEGADVIAVDVCAPVESVKYPNATTEDLAETARMVEHHDRRIQTYQADVRDLSALEEAVRQGVDRLGRLDIVVANAGIMTAGRLWEITPEQWDQVIAVNLTGVWHTIKATVPILIGQGTGGSVILVSSPAGLVGTPFIGHYVASKHGVVGLCRTLANEVGEYNIRVNSIHPSPVNTILITDPDLGPLIEQYATTLAPLFMNTLPFTMMEPEDVSGLVAFLAGDDARYMTGAQVPLDMGLVNR
jgi:SDR family mycofactocin-dependent oxidoreductase